MCFVLRLNATNEAILEETLEDNNDIIDVNYKIVYACLFACFIF